MHTESLLIIFIRNPELGKVKTRLAKSVGNVKALEIYKLLLQKTKETTKQIKVDKVVYYSEKIIAEDIWGHSYSKELQKGANLGEKMQHAFTTAFNKGYKHVAIIGSDLYDLEPHHINEAFKKLNHYKVVIGPAKDGGYYLLGLTKMYDAIFKNKHWGTATVRQDTLKNLEKVPLHLLEELNDIDVIQDLENHPAFAHFIKEI